MHTVKDTHPDDPTWKVTISKTELADLPAASYSGKITLVDTLEDAEKATRILAAEQEIGFDTETKPSFRRGQSHKVSLMQLSTHDQCFLFRLNHIGMPDCLREILESPSLLKIGVSIHDDFLNLHKISDLEPDGFIDLQSYVKQFKIADNSLSRIYGILFGNRISKGQRLSNWEASELTQHQQEYAALDALACLRIYDYLQENGFDWNDSEYYRETEDPNQPKPEA